MVVKGERALKEIAEKIGPDFASLRKQKPKFGALGQSFLGKKYHYRQK